MPTYVSLGRFTRKGAQDLKGLPTRIQAHKALALANGGEIKGVYAALGQYDLITVFEAPNDEAATLGAMAVAGGGNLTTETMRVFTESEIEALVAQIPG
ncbi:MAG: GYD domain-containing protein [Candidatus Dormibacteraeota bacterium]|nr:GYD domain-containing protein [Candidatus Dormibacteraeota bacterium]